MFEQLFNVIVNEHKPDFNEMELVLDECIQVKNIDNRLNFTDFYFRYGYLDIVKKYGSKTIAILPTEKLNENIQDTFDKIFKILINYHKKVAELATEFLGKNADFIAIIRESYEAAQSAKKQPV